MHAPLKLKPELGRPSLDGRFELALQRFGPRTVIGRQFVSYPFHLTRGFRLDPQVPSMLTLYQQSCSGGIYRGDRMTTCLDLAENSAAQVTTQSAALVHDCHGEAADLTARFRLEPDSYLAYTPDPVVLFPGAALTSDINLTLSEGSVALLQDMLSWHDPQQRERPFDHASFRVNIEDEGGRLLARDRFSVTGDEWASGELGLADWQMMCCFFLIGDPSRLPGQDALVAALDVPEVQAGVSVLPNGCGWYLRGLARNANAARTLSDRIFALSFSARHGHAPALRRK